MLNRDQIAKIAASCMTTPTYNLFMAKVDHAMKPQGGFPADLRGVFPYRVEWKIDVDAESALEAARQALKIQRDPTSIATFFTVTHRNSGVSVDIDLEDHQ